MHFRGPFRKTRIGVFTTRKDGQSLRTKDVEQVGLQIAGAGGPIFRELEEHPGPEYEKLLYSDEDIPERCKHTGC